MKIKASLSLLFLFFIFSTVHAQRVDCSRELSLYAQSAKIKDYDSAKPHYKTLIDSCPDMHVAIYQYGTRMFRHYLKESDDKAEQKKYAQDLIRNYQYQLKYFPRYSNEALFDRRIGQLQVDYDLSTTEEEYKLFDASWKLDKKAFNDPKALYTYISLLIDLQDAGKKDLQEVFKKYDEVMDKIKTEEAKRAKTEEELRKKKESGQQLTAKEARTLSNNKIYLKGYTQIKSSIDTKIGKRADCDNLIPLYEKKFDAHKDDLDWLKIAARRLSAKKCTKGDLFVKITKALNRLNPSAKSAMYLGQLAEHKGKTSEAIKYYKQSIELEDNKLDKARVYYHIAKIYQDRKSYSAARNYYHKALKNNPALGAAYLKIAGMYAASVNNCGKDNFHKRAVYWLAEKLAKRAGRVDPSLRSTAQQAAAAYGGRAPARADIFKAEMGGKTITVNCWIHKQVQVPNL